MTRARLLLIAVSLLLVAGSARRGEAHKPITSPFTYNDDVFPIVREHCGSCHVAGGVAPMSLLTYKDAFPWGESIRTELIAGHMPPWRVDNAVGLFRNARPLSGRELNVLLTWVTGGNPIGNASHAPPPVAPPPDWRLGPPDLVVQMPAAFTVAADATEATEDFTLPATTERRFVRAVDVRPGNRAIVRSATVSVKGPPDGRAAAGREGAMPAERVLAVWVPGDDPIALDAGAAFQLPAGADLVLRVHYKKTWENERLEMMDRSSVGLYFADATASEVRALTLAPPPAQGVTVQSALPAATAAAPSSRDRISFSHTLDETVQAIAIYPDRELARVQIDVGAERPDGTRLELIRFRPQPDWARRYWFTEPITLPRGTRITVTASVDDTLLPPGAAPVVARPPDPSSLRLTLNVVAAR